MVPKGETGETLLEWVETSKDEEGLDVRNELAAFSFSARFLKKVHSAFRG